MVEAPRIRINCESLTKILGQTVLKATGYSYEKFKIDLTNYVFMKIWFAGKYIYFLLKFENEKVIIRTHLLMYGKILTTKLENVKPFMTINCGSNKNIYWYRCQIFIVKFNSSTSLIPTNYGENISVGEILKISHQMARRDISHPNFNKSFTLKNSIVGLEENPKMIATDFLLNQYYFPGVGNILQTEALYRCKVNPLRLLELVTKSDINCLILKLKILCDKMYEAHKKDLPAFSMLIIYHKAYCPLGHKTITKVIGDRQRRVTWCPICQEV
jgi:formamidopyrimidine-DNA glycosylase